MPEKIALPFTTALCIFTDEFSSQLHSRYSVLSFQATPFVHPFIASIWRSFAHSCIALILASNYFAFQVELFDGEYEANHPSHSDPTSSSITQPSLGWETFDKDNAPKAFVVNTDFIVEVLCVLPVEIGNEHPPHIQFFHLRDKSPPSHPAVTNSQA